MKQTALTRAFDKTMAGLTEARAHARDEAVKGLKVHHRDIAQVTYAAYEMADILDTEAVIAEYLTASAAEGNAKLLLKAESNVAKAKGKMKAVKDAE